jgi:hypothetical protein
LEEEAKMAKTKKMSLKSNPHQSAFEKVPEKVPITKTAAIGGHKSFVLNAPGTTRTCDLLVRSQTLYPTELRALLMNGHFATSFTPMSIMRKSME